MPLTRSRKVVGVGLLLGVGLFLVGTVVGRGSWWHLFLAWLAGACAIIVLAAGLISASVAAASLDGGRPGRLAYRIAEASFCLLAVFAPASLSMIPGSAWNDRDLQEAITYCEGMVPELEAYREANGAYPKDLADIGRNEQDRPRLLHQRFYWSNGADGYKFRFLDPAEAWLSGPLYNSATGEWGESSD